MSRDVIRLAGILILVLAGVWLFMGWLLPIILPFLLGMLLARISEPAIHFLHNRTGMRRGGAVAIAVTGVFLLFLTVISFLLALLVRQVQDLSRLLPQFIETFTDAGELLRQWLQQKVEKIPGGLGTMAANLTEELFSGGSAWMERLGAALPKVLTGLLGSLSSGLLGLVTTMIAAYMIANRLPAIRIWWQNHAPKHYREKWQPWLRDLKKSLGGWLLAELKLAGVAFGVMVAGFLLLRVRHSFLWAGVIAVVDAFPILGVGTVLVPWAVICFLQGNSVRAVGLLGIYGVVWLSRSILEPKWIGKGLGLDPLATLAASYAGWKLWGVVGMLLSPILTLTVLQAVKQMKR